MLPPATLQVPASLATLPAVFSPLFTVPSFRTFCGLVCGFPAQPGRRTVCGMLTGAGLARAWPHDRAHRFFSGARRDPDEPGLAAARQVAALLVPAGAPADLAVDDTLLKRRGEEDPGRLLVPRRGRAGAREDGIREQLGSPRDRCPATRHVPPGRGPGDGEAGDQGIEPEIAAVTGPADGCGTARPPGPRRGRLGLRGR